MPLNKAERKMKKELEDTYGKARGESIFYAMEKQGKTPHSKEDKGTMKAKKKGYNVGGMVPQQQQGVTNYNQTSAQLHQQQQGMMQMQQPMAKGGMVKKQYAHGGVVTANCGASMKPNRKAKK